MAKRGRHKILVRQWTDVQRFCYARNCNCEGCSVPILLESLKNGKCWVKITIQEYIKQHGTPPGLETKGIISDEKDIETGG